MRGKILLLLMIVMLIDLVAVSDFYIAANSALEQEASLQDFISWKQQKGFRVVTGFFGEDASVEEIDSWIESEYQSSDADDHFL